MLARLGVEIIDMGVVKDNKELLERAFIEAAEKAVSQGIDTFIINGFTELSFNQLLAGKNPGTHFQPAATPLSEQQHWMTHTSKAQGELIVENSDRGNIVSKIIKRKAKTSWKYFSYPFLKSFMNNSRGTRQILALGI